MSGVHPAATYNVSEEVYELPMSYFTSGGKVKSLCSCGLSKSMPFCDGSHHGTGIKSMKVDIKGDKMIIKSKQQIKVKKEEAKKKKIEEENKIIAQNYQSAPVIAFAFGSILLFTLAKRFL